NMNKRIASLLDFLEESVSVNNIDNDLLRIGEKVFWLLKSRSFSHGDDLMNEGYALAADMGLLIAKLLRETCPSVQWVVLRKPRSGMAYNLPVLSGFGSLTLDPVGGSIAEAQAILSDKRSFDVWKNIYSFWRDKASKVHLQKT